MKRATGKFFNSPAVNIAIIGAGPAGIYTTLFLNKLPGEVHLFEQNKDVGEKLKTTGGGRMNVTNKVFSPTEFSSTDHRWVQRLFKNPHFAGRYKLLEELEIKYQWEKNRAILRSQDAIAEVARLKQKVKTQQNCTLHLETKIQAVKKMGEKFIITTTAQENHEFDKVVITTGGMYRMFDLGPKEKTYELPLSLEHSVTDVSPSLCALIFRDKPLRAFSGISFVGRLNDEVTGKSTTDDLLITHFGISGPAALDFSSYAGEKVTLSFITEVSESEFIAAFNQLRNGKNSLKKFLKSFLPERLIKFHLERAEIDQDFIADLPKAKLQKLIISLFHYPLPPRQANVYPGSWTTKGGIALEQIQTKNLESKIISGLHFAGEILDFNGLCGGYNISFALISARIVADSLRADR